MSVWTLSAKIEIHEMFLDFVTMYAYFLHEIIFKNFVKKFLRRFVSLLD